MSWGRARDDEKVRRLEREVRRLEREKAALVKARKIRDQLLAEAVRDRAASRAEARSLRAALERVLIQCQQAHGPIDPPGTGRHHDTPRVGTTLDERL